jgi:steroid 5-alpha reductase family enzyme
MNYEPIQSGWLIAGLTVWALGYITETKADNQLKTFVINPKNKGTLMTDGLWKFSRHPNYFGEMLQWWGIWVVSVGTGFGLYAIVGPLVITWLLLFVSGVPLAEKRAANKPGWNTYKKQTSMIVPWPAKK